MANAMRSLPAAVRLAIQHGNALSDINLVRWAETYAPATTEDVRRIWDAVLSEESLKPKNCEEMDK